MTNPFPDELTFAVPAIFWLLTFSIPLIFLKIAADRRAAQTSRKFVASKRLRRRLIPRVGMNSWVVFGLRLVALSMFVTALARPQMGEITETVETEGRNILIAIDTSKSMLAPDLPPNRLVMSKLAAVDVVESMAGDRIGLIAFAGRPHLHIPLTVDHNSLVGYLNLLDIDSAPRGGTNLGYAIDLAVGTFDNDLGGSNALIIFTDGDELEGSAIESATRAKEKGVLIVAIGTGTSEGEIIPDPDNPGEYIRDEENNKIVRTRLNPTTLRAIASETGGAYLDLSNIKLSSNAVSRVLDGLESSTFGATEETRKKERYQVPLAIGLVCLLASFLARMLAPVRVAPVVARIATANSSAAVLLWAFLVMGGLVTPGAQAEVAQPRDPSELYRDGQYERALEKYNALAKEAAEESTRGAGGVLSRILNRLPTSDPDKVAKWHYGAGAAAFKIKDYEAAQQSFSDALQAEDEELRSRAHHGLASTLFKRGEALQNLESEVARALWTEALEHYEQTIALDPANQVAPRNAAYIRNLLKVQVKPLQFLSHSHPPNENSGNSQPEPRDPNSGEGKDPNDGETSKPPPSDVSTDPKSGDPEEKENSGEGTSNQDSPGEGSEGEDPDGESEKEGEKSREEVAIETLRRFSDEIQKVDFMPKSFRPMGFKDW